MSHEVGAQPSLGARQIVLDQQCGRFHQVRILGRGSEEARPRLIRAGRVAGNIEMIREQAPRVGGIGFQLQCAPQRDNRLADAPRLATRNTQLQMHGSRMRLLPGQRVENLNRKLSVTRNPVRGAQNQASMRMARNGLEDLTCLLGGERGIPLQQSGSMPQRNIQCSNGLRSTVQLNIQSIPAHCYGLIRISRRRFVKSTTRVGGARKQPN